MELRKKGILVLMIFIAFLRLTAKDVTESYLKSKPNGNTLDEKKWDKLKDDYKYKSIEIDTTKKVQKAKKTPNMSMRLNWIEILAYLFVFALITLVLYLLFRYGYFGSKELKNKKTLFSVIENPEDIDSLDIDPLLAEALKNKEFRLALRLKYLALLKLLSNQGLIKWKREFTNRNYADQLRESTFYGSFIQSTFIYESGWYGNYVVDEGVYLKSEQLFKQIENQIKEYV